MVDCHKTKPNQTKPNPIHLIYMYKPDLVLNDLQRLACHKTQPNQVTGLNSHHQWLCLCVSDKQKSIYYTRKNLFHQYYYLIDLTIGMSLKLYPVVRLLFCSCGVSCSAAVESPFLCHYFQLHSNLGISFLAPTVGQVDLFVNYLYLEYLKPNYCLSTNY